MKLISCCRGSKSNRSYPAETYASCPVLCAPKTSAGVPVMGLLSRPYQTRWQRRWYTVGSWLARSPPKGTALIDYRGLTNGLDCVMHFNALSAVGCHGPVKRRRLPHPVPIWTMCGVRFFEIFPCFCVGCDGVPIISAALSLRPSVSRT